MIDLSKAKVTVTATCEERDCEACELEADCVPVGGPDDTTREIAVGIRSLLELLSEVARTDAV